MDKKIYYNNLYDYYASLFTEKQRAYYEDYYFRDLSLSEIAENNHVSRNAVHNQIKSVEENLDFYEEKMGLYQKACAIRKLIQELEEPLKSEIEKII